MKKVLLVVMVLISVPLLAQPSIIGTSPTNNATNVPLNTTIKIWFASPVDTTQNLGMFNGYLTSIDTILSQTFSADADTMYMQVRLAPSRAYFIAFYWVPGPGEFTTPYGYEFTTGSSFTGTTVGGTITSNAPGVSAAYALVGLSDVPVAQSQPHFVAGTVADINGNFTIPYVPNGTLYPVSAKDAIPDGNIDPSSGDAVGIGSSINVSGSPITGLALSMNAGFAMAYSVALDSALIFQNAYLPGSLLRRVTAYRADSAGNSLSDWQFYYYTPPTDSVTQVNVQSFMTGTKPPDSGTKLVMRYLRTITNPGSAASSAVFIANCESNGGLTFRHMPVQSNWKFYRTLQLGQLWYSNMPSQYAPDSTNFYWMAQYHFDLDYNQDSSSTQLSMYFIGDFTTGAIISTVSVDPSRNGVPGTFALAQNYPNPFNPTTMISYQLSAVSEVRLVVYDLLGREVGILVNERKAPGTYDVRFDASALASGMYLYRLTSGNFVQTRKMIVVK